jgi:hypothetical protein
MRRIFFATILVLLVPLSAFAQTELTYWQDVRPIFRKHCTACHSTKNMREVDVSGGLALDTYAAAKKGTKRVVITPGNGDQSLLYDLLTTTDVKKRMPLDSDPLSKAKIALIKKWIDSGAKEGTPPPEVVTLPTKKAATRKLDVLLPTGAIAPTGFAGQKAAGRLELAMKIGPLAPVTAVAFSPDNKFLATGSYGQVVIWDLIEAKPAKLLTNVLGAVNDIRFSPKGDILAVGGGQPSAKGDLRLYQTSDWKLLATLRGHDDVVFSLAFSPDGTQLASASFDHSVRLWDVKTHASLRDYHHHSDFVYAVAFSPNGKQMVSASKDRTVALFDVETGKGVFTFSGMDQDPGRPRHRGPRTCVQPGRQTHRLRRRRSHSALLGCQGGNARKGLSCRFGYVLGGDQPRLQIRCLRQFRRPGAPLGRSQRPPPRHAVGSR